MTLKTEFFKLSVKDQGLSQSFQTNILLSDSAHALERHSGVKLILKVYTFCKIQFLYLSHCELITVWLSI